MQMNQGYVTALPTDLDNLK